MKKLNQSGAVSIVSVVIFITIITVVVVAYLASSLSQQRTAVNFDMGTRAYYAAESGVQDAVRGLDPTVIAGKQDCKPFSPSSSDGSLGKAGVDYGLAYTCQIIDPTPAEVTGTIEPGASGTTAMIRLDPVASGTPPYRLVVRWSPKTQTGVPPLIPRDDTTRQQSLKQLSEWSSGAGDWHPMLKLAVASHPLNNSFSRDQINQRVVFINPVENDQSLTFNKAASLATSDTMSDAMCEPSDTVSSEFSCKKTISLTGYDFSADAIYVRIGALYRSTTFSLQLVDSSNTTIQLKNTQVVVDVTGRAKNVYRRVKQAFNLRNSLTDSQGDAAVVAGEGICKNFSITTIPSEFKAQCNPLTD